MSNPPTMTDEKRLRACEAYAEEAYAKMCDAHNPTDATGCYSDAKEGFADAIGLAQRLGRSDDVKRLEARLAHVKAVFRSQFT
jgi:hypothetical protein